MRKFLTPAIVGMFLTISVCAQTNITVRIDPDNARGGTASQIFDAIRFIPLETNQQSLFGTINQLEVTDSFFIILDIQSRSIILFNRDGRFHTRIKSDGSDKYFNYFSIDRTAQTIIVTNNYANGLLVYDFDGRFIKKIPRPEKIRSLYSLGNNTLIHNLRRSSENKKKPPLRPDLFKTGYKSFTIFQSL